MIDIIFSICSLFTVESNKFPPKTTHELNMLQSSETDWNRDGIKDYLDLEIKMPLTNRENVYGIKLMVFFDVKFHFFSQVGMEAMAYLCSNSGMPSSRSEHLTQLFCLHFFGKISLISVE